VRRVRRGGQFCLHCGGDDRVVPRRLTGGGEQDGVVRRAGADWRRGRRGGPAGGVGARRQRDGQFIRRRRLRLRRCGRRFVAGFGPDDGRSRKPGGARRGADLHADLQRTGGVEPVGDEPAGGGAVGSDLRVGDRWRKPQRRAGRVGPRHGSAGRGRPPDVHGRGGVGSVRGGAADERGGGQ
jgi:hypothetical protein